MLNIILVFLGVAFFAYSIFKLARLLKLISDSSFKKWWIALLLLIVFFCIGYIIFGYFLLTGSSFLAGTFMPLLVSLVFFFGAIFVVITISLIFSTLSNLEAQSRSAESTKEEIKKNEERFKQVAETAEEWIWEVDKEGLYTYASPIVEKVLGYKPEEIIGKKYFYDLFTPDVREDLKKAAFEVFGRKEIFRNFLNPNIHKNGSIVLLETSGRPVLDEKGNLLGYRGLDTDVTSRKKSEEELKNRTEELGRMNKIMAGRELKVIELKKEIEELKKK